MNVLMESSVVEEDVEAMVIILEGLDYCFPGAVRPSRLEQRLLEYSRRNSSVQRTWRLGEECVQLLLGGFHEL